MATVSTVERTFHDFISAKKYPCTGAKLAQNKSGITIHVANDLSVNENDNAILCKLYQFIEKAAKAKHDFSSFVCIFPSSGDYTEQEFDENLWKKLQSLHNLDRKFHAWDKAVSPNPNDPQFSFSLGGQAFFIIGLHPNSRRKSRQFTYPTLVFNLHSQFERLKEHKKFESLRNTIRKKDEAYSGESSAFLHDYGTASEARQYSGIDTSNNWQCPFTFKG